MRYIGIVGSRRRGSHNDYLLVLAAFEKIYQKGDGIVSGGCPRGADRFAEIIAKAKGIPILIFYPDWKLHGRGAGFVRNTFIAQRSYVMIACVSEDRRGGTEDTIEKFMKSHASDELYLC